MNSLKPCTLALALFAAAGPATVSAQDASVPATTPPPMEQPGPAAQAPQQSDPAMQPQPAPQAAPAAQAPPAQAAPATGPVTVKSLQPDSVVGEYKIDFNALDRNHDGCISRAEARSNATLTAEFRAVDEKGKGCLDKAALAGWM